MTIRKYKYAFSYFIAMAGVFISAIALPETSVAQNQAGQKLNIDTFMVYANPYAPKGLVLASYPGGTPAFIKFIAAHMQLPDSLKVTGQDPGVKFIDKVSANVEIEKDGTVSGVELLHSIYDWPDIKGKIHNVLTSALKMSVWQPATVNNEPVAGGHFISYIWFIKK